MELPADLTERTWTVLLETSGRLVEWLLASGARIVLIVVLGWIGLRVLRHLVRRMHELLLRRDTSSERVKRADTLSGIVRAIGAIVIVMAASMMVLREIGIDIAPILAAAGIGGLAIGFGAQSLVKDVISGFFLLVEDQMRIGDVVEVAGKSGVVEGMGLRTIRLRDLAGNVHVVPNGVIDVVTNMTKDFSRYVFDVGVAYREDTDEVCAALLEVGDELGKDPAFRADILEPLEIFGVDRFADSAVVIKARITTRPMRQWAVGREFNRRLKKRFDEKGIEIPFPHLTLWAGQDKDGSAPPLRIDGDRVAATPRERS